MVRDDDLFEKGGVHQCNIMGGEEHTGNHGQTMLLIVKKRNKILGLNVNMRAGESKFLPIIAVKWEDKMLAYM